MFLRYCSVWLIFTAVVVSSWSYSQEPTRLSRPAISPAVWGVLEQPHAPGTHPGVVILHGSRGWRPEYAQYAKALADSGFVALALSHFVETGRDTVMRDPRQAWATWHAVVRNAVRYLSALPSTKGQKLGLVGFSHGAFLAISVASSLPEVRAVVDFYGGYNTAVRTRDEQLSSFPPLLILHGDADTLVSVDFARYLKDAIERRGGQVELHIYPGAHHAFNSKVYPTYSDSLAKDSFRLTVDFLARRLRN